MFKTERRSIQYASVGAFKALIHFVCCHHFSSLRFFQRQQEALAEMQTS